MRWNDARRQRATPRQVALSRRKPAKRVMALSLGREPQGAVSILSEPAEPGDSLSPARRVRVVFWAALPGAGAPGFMLTPAPQAKPIFGGLRTFMSPAPARCFESDILRRLVSAGHRYREQNSNQRHCPDAGHIRRFCLLGSRNNGGFEFSCCRRTRKRRAALQGSRRVANRSPFFGDAGGAVQAAES